jgi:cell division protein FtsL
MNLVAFNAQALRELILGLLRFGALWLILALILVVLIHLTRCIVFIHARRQLFRIEHTLNTRAEERDGPWRGKYLNRPESGNLGGRAGGGWGDGGDAP